jgi:hypothetical protein
VILFKQDIDRTREPLHKSATGVIFE